jgi:predicted DNA-binding protein (MmcQ/YjbR family)
MDRLEAIVGGLPEAQRVDIEAWGDEPTFRVNGKNFVFCAPDATSITVKLPREEAEAVCATDPACTPAGYGLGRAGWVNVDLTPPVAAARWDEIADWVRTSYTLVAPKRLAKLVE